MTLTLKPALKPALKPTLKPTAKNKLFELHTTHACRAFILRAIMARICMYARQAGYVSAWTLSDVSIDNGMIYMTIRDTNDAKGSTHMSYVGSVASIEFSEDHKIFSRYTFVSLMELFQRSLTKNEACEDGIVYRIVVHQNSVTECLDVEVHAQLASRYIKSVSECVKFSCVQVCEERGMHGDVVQDIWTCEGHDGHDGRDGHDVRLRYRDNVYALGGVDSVYFSSSLHFLTRDTFMSIIDVLSKSTRKDAVVIDGVEHTVTVHETGYDTDIDVTFVARFQSKFVRPMEDVLELRFKMIKEVPASEPRVLDNATAAHVLRMRMHAELRARTRRPHEVRGHVRDIAQTLQRVRGCAQVYVSRDAHATDAVAHVCAMNVAVAKAAHTPSESVVRALCDVIYLFRPTGLQPEDPRTDRLFPMYCLRFLTRGSLYQVMYNTMSDVFEFIPPTADGDVQPVVCTQIKEVVQSSHFLLKTFSVHVDRDVQYVQAARRLQDNAGDRAAVYAFAEGRVEFIAPHTPNDFLLAFVDVLG